MGAQHSLSLRLQVEIESRSHLAAYIGMQKTHGIDEMLGEPASAPAFGCHLPELLRDRRAARDDPARLEIAHAGRGGSSPVYTGVLVKAMILKGNSYARQPFPHFAELDRNLHSGLRRSNLCDLAPVVIEQSECAGDGPLQFVR